MSKTLECRLNSTQNKSKNENSDLAGTLRTEDKVRPILSHRDRIGLDFEIYCFSEFLKANLTEYLTFWNPINDPLEWKRHVGEGCDFRFNVKGELLEVEVKYHLNPNWCRVEWWNNDYVPRFTYADTKVQKVILTNSPEFYDTKYVRTNPQGIFIMTISELIDYIRYIVDNKD